MGPLRPLELVQGTFGALSIKNLRTPFSTPLWESDEKVFPFEILERNFVSKLADPRQS